jgi:general secretion pathway protein G
MTAERRAGGFTLVELLVTVAIVAILASAALPLAELGLQRQKEAELARSLREIRGALDAYKKAWDESRIERRVGQSGYPPNLDALVQGVVDAKDPQKKRIYFLRRLPRDPFHDDNAASAAATWAKRSYESPPDAPAEGADVFDVYSRSTRVGLNGRPYREW